MTVLLNPDCELPDAGIARWSTAPPVRDALLVPRLLDADGSRAAQRPSAPRRGPAALARAVAAGPRAAPSPTAHVAPRRVGWAIAACWSRATPLLARLGPFDPAAFLFYEDLDLCLRARAAGVPTVLHPEVALRHLGGRSTVRPMAARRSTCRRAAGAR